MTEHSRTRWIVGTVITLLGAGGGIVALVEYFNKPRAMMSALEHNTDRYGGVEHSNFTAATPEDCSEACRLNPACAAFSYNVSANQCWLKGDVPLRVENPGFISGVKRY